MEYVSGINTFETFVVFDKSGGRYFFDSIDAAQTWSRVLGGRLKACYNIAAEIKAYEEVDVSLDLEPDWDEINEQIQTDQLDQLEGDVPGGDEQCSEDGSSPDGGDKLSIRRDMRGSNQRTYATRSLIKVIRR